MDTKDKKKVYKVRIRSTTRGEGIQIAHKEKKRIATRAKELLKEGLPGIVKVLDEWIDEKKEVDGVRLKIKKQIKKGSGKLSLSKKDKEILEKASNRDYFYEYNRKPFSFLLQLLNEPIENLLWQIRCKTDRSAAADMIEKRYVRLLRWADNEGPLSIHNSWDNIVLSIFKNRMLKNLKKQIEDAIQAIQKQQLTESKENKKAIKEKEEPHRIPAESKLLAVLVTNQYEGWTKSRIATEASVSRTKMYQCPAFIAAYEIAKQRWRDRKKKV